MTKFKILLKEFTEEALQDFFAFSEKEGQKEIYLNSPGGLTAIGETLIHVINSEPENYHVVVVGEANSAAFNLVLRVTCNVTILDTASAAIHVSTWTLPTRDLNNPESEAYFVHKVLGPDRIENYLQ